MYAKHSLSNSSNKFLSSVTTYSEETSAEYLVNPAISAYKIVTSENYSVKSNFEDGFYKNLSRIFKFKLIKKIIIIDM